MSDLWLINKRVLYPPLDAHSEGHSFEIIFPACLPFKPIPAIPAYPEKLHLTPFDESNNENRDTNYGKRKKQNKPYKQKKEGRTRTCGLSCFLHLPLALLADGRFVFVIHTI